MRLAPVFAYTIKWSILLKGCAFRNEAYFRLNTLLLIQTRVKSNLHVKMGYEYRLHTLTLKKTIPCTFLKKTDEYVTSAASLL